MLINALIGTSVVARESDSAPFFRSLLASSTSFDDDPISIPINDASDSLDTASLPLGALSIYTNATQCLVAVLPYGAGRVVFLGWDWWNAAPVGSQDGGWLQVLDSAVNFRPLDDVPLLLQQPKSQTAVLGEAVIFNVAATASTPLTYQWLRNGLPIANATNAVLTIDGVQSDDFGNYRVRVSNVFGSILSSSVSLRSVLAPAEFFNSDFIRIPQTDTEGRAEPYPSIIRVNGMSGLIGRVEVTFNKLTHTYPADLDVLLVNPGGQKVILMSDAGGRNSATNLNLTFTERASVRLPTSLPTNGFYQPANYEEDETLPSPAPNAPYSDMLSTFDGFPPNGDWLLYINDDEGEDTGSLGGWSLRIYSASPPNDAFMNRIELTGLVVALTGNNAYATKENGEPRHAGEEGGRSIWWTWVCPTEGEVTIDTTGSSFDTLLAVYTGNSVSNLSWVASNDDDIALQSKVTFFGTPGATYQIAVDGYGGANGDVVLNLASRPPPPLELSCPSDIVVVGFENVPAPDPNLLFVSGGCLPVTRMFLGDSRTTSGCETLIRRSYQVVDSCFQTNFCFQIITVLSEPEILGITVTQTTQPDGIHVLFCASVVGGVFPYEWSLDGGGTMFLNNSCFEAVFPPTDEASHSVNLIVRNSCGFNGSSSPPVVPCGFCVSRETPSVLTGDTGSGTGPALEAGACGTLNPASTRWYTITAYDTGLLTVSTEGSANNTMLAIYTAPANQFVACNEDVSLSSRQSRVTFSAIQGTRYKIAVDPRSASPNLRLAVGFEPRIETYTLWPDRSFELLSSRAPAIPYRLEASSVLGTNANWLTVLATNLTESFPYVYYRETNLMQSSRRFYRIVSGL